MQRDGTNVRLIQVLMNFENVGFMVERAAQRSVQRWKRRARDVDHRALHARDDTDWRFVHVRVRSLPKVPVTLPAGRMGWFDMYQNAGDKAPNNASVHRLPELIALFVQRRTTRMHFVHTSVTYLPRIISP